MQIEIREVSPVLVEVHASIPWDRIRVDLDQRFAKLTRTARLKGFRPGKVPLTVVKNLFRQQVENEAMNALMQEAIEKAVTENEILLAAAPEVAPPSLTAGEPFAFVAKCQMRPRIKEVVVDGLEVYKELDAVGDAEVDAAIESLRDQHATVQEPEPARPARSGDVLTVSFQLTIDGKRREDLDVSERTVELGKGSLLPELDAALVGASVGEHKVASVTYGPDHGNEELRGKTAEFGITVSGMKEKVLPDLDDAFAEDCGAENVAALKAKKRAELESAAQKRSETAIKDQLVDAVCAKNPIEVPPALVQEQSQQLMQQMMQFARMLGGPPPREMMADLDVRAERRVRASILLGAVARLNALEVTEDDLNAKLAKLAEASKKQVARLKAEYADPERRSQLENQILEEKIVAFLTSKAKLLDGKRPSPEKA